MTARSIRAQNQARQWLTETAQEATAMQEALHTMEAGTVTLEGIRDLEDRLDSIRRNIACAKFALEVDR